MQLELVAFVRCPDLIGCGGLFMKNQNQNQCLFALSHFNHLVWSGSDIHCCKDIYSREREVFLVQIKGLLR
ncbi:unnamed protein product [Rhodiola kirilowii]